MNTIWQKFKSLDGFKKRGIIYITIASLGTLYELTLVRPIRIVVLLLWLAVGLVGLYVWKNIRDV